MDRCEECGFDYEAVTAEEAVTSIVVGADEMAAVLRDGDADLRRRRAPGQWSPLEYGCHLRDVLLVQRERVLLARRRERPSLEPMGSEERAAHDGYAEQDPREVAEHIAMTARLLAGTLSRLQPPDWDRTLMYNYPQRAERSLRWVAAHTVHEVRHHLLDVRRQVEGRAVDAGSVSERHDPEDGQGGLMSEAAAVRQLERELDSRREVLHRERAREMRGRQDDVLRLCQAMLAGDLPMDGPDPATGMVPVGVARVGNVAVAAVADFGRDYDGLSTMTFVRDGAGWRCRGGGQGRSQDGIARPVADRLAEWSRRPAAAEWDGDLLGQAGGGGSTAIPRAARQHGHSYVTSIVVRCAAEVTHLDVDQRRLEIPWHGRVLVAWLTGSRLEVDDRSGERRVVPARSPFPDIVAVSATGTRFRLPDDPRRRHR